MKNVFTKMRKVIDFRFSRIKHDLQVLLLARLAILIGLLLPIEGRTQQEGSISVQGVVYDAATSETLPGVNILLKGTNVGTITDVDGSFSIQVPDSESVLVFSFIGFLNQEVRVGTRSSLEVRLAASATDLNEVVVVGYGTQKKSDLTGAVTRVDASTFQNQPLSQVSDMLAGTVAGFYGNQGTSASGGSSLEVRGPTSLTGGTSPLIVIDGVIFHGEMADINPNDIESIDILKDASSAAVFGSKAASGVVMITTKKGGTGNPTISFSAKTGINTITNDDFRPRDAAGYEDFRRDFFRTLGIANRPDFYWDDPNNLRQGVTVEQWRSANENSHPDNTREYLGRLNFFDVEIDQYLAGNTMDWFNEVTRQGFRQDYDISISGGDDKFQYYWSLGYLDNENMRVGDDFQAIRSRFNLDFKVTDWLSVGTNAQVSNRDNSSVPASLSISAISPYSSKYEEDGSLRWYPHGYPIILNPLINNVHQERLNKVTGIFASLYADVDLPLGFHYRVSYQPRFDFEKNYNFWGTETIVGGRDRVDGYGTRSDYSLNAWMVDNILTWDKTIGAHTLNVTLLYNAEQTKTYTSYGENQIFRPNQVLGYNGLQFGSRPLVNTNDTEAGGNAMMARLNYTFQGKYLLTTSVRRDGYSAFGAENNIAVFPALALGWIVSDESFFPESSPISLLKLRGSWGINGNRDIGIYSALAQIGTTLYYDGSNVQMGLFNNTLANPGLRWEKTQAYNLGLDLALFENRVDLSAEFYDMTTTDLLMSRQLPEITGFSSIMANLGELSNKGMDLTLNTVNVNNSNIMWKTNFVFSLNRNRIEKLFGDTEEVVVNGQTVVREVPDYTNEWFPGQPIDVVWDYNVLGVWQLDEADQASTYTMRPGDYKGEDVNGDGVYDALVDKQFIGYTRPRYRLGLRNDVTFLKDFTASVFLRADLGHIGDFPYAIHESSTYDRINYWNIPYWTPTNPNNEYARTSEVHGAYGGGLRIFKPRSFLRVQDLSLAYNFPSYLTDRLQTSSLRVFVSARNLFTITNWPGWDPESGNTPMPKSYTLGINLTL
ncbi:SusC/RagA family TonB-linked outer membrane protein [Cyclobacterium jeungdonense]|uniref:TonB-dependent receptor n=1 Tax=Cyclobacterium jeungdonense TaxID=708087 RepID=A0ABT8C8U8_9BACT|nr:TonB-dependent receptor [Cyclobacterium jeungdonense]MDN3688961.1 TonB-dependent receptor [Cyclobacterium jeungdonense]